MTAQAQMRFWFAVLVVLGFTLLAGVVLTVVDLLTLRPPPALKQASAHLQAGESNLILP